MQAALICLFFSIFSKIDIEKFRILIDLELDRVFITIDAAEIIFALGYGS